MKTFMTRLLALPVLLLFAALTAGDALAMKLDNTGPWPVCNGDQAQIDPDGDGWGWQDGETCKYKFDDDDDDVEIPTLTVLPRPIICCHA